MIGQRTVSWYPPEVMRETLSQRSATVARFVSKLIMIAGIALFVYGVGWDYSTRTYLKGFVDAIIPLSGSPEEKTEALAAWFRKEPLRDISLESESDGLIRDRDPVHIVQNLRLLRVCGTASNAFMNLADSADLKVRRLLLLDSSGGTMHVVGEVKWGDRWIVANPQQGLVYRNGSGRALTKEELRDPAVFRDAISRMPGYDPEWTFERTVHVRMKRIPLLGGPLRVSLDRLLPGWEEAINWSYFAENPALWLIVISFPVFLLGVVGNWSATRFGNVRRNPQTASSHS
jgi:hypothetical protein